MRPADLDLLEQRLGMTLPPGYRALVLDAGFAGDDYVLDDPARLLELNRRWRQSGDWDAGWFAVGEGFEADVYFIDTRAEPVQVLCRSADGTVEVWMPHLADLAASVRGRRPAPVAPPPAPPPAPPAPANSEALPPGVSLDEAARYLFENFSRFMTDDELRRYYDSVEIDRAGRAVEVLSDDPELRAVQRSKNAQFRDYVVRRVLRDHGGEVVFNRCPSCSALCRTPSARQCFRCNHTWR